MLCSSLCGLLTKEFGEVPGIILKLGLREGVFTRKTARQSCLFYLFTVCAAAVHCEVMRIEAGAIARRAKITRQ